MIAENLGTDLLHTTKLLDESPTRRVPHTCLALVVAELFFQECEHHELEQDFPGAGP